MRARPAWWLAHAPTSPPAAPLLPKYVVDRLAKGENPVRVLREWRDVTQLYLSFKANLSQGYISDVETGRRTGTAAALRRIAVVLEVPLDLLVSD